MTMMQANSLLGAVENSQLRLQDGAALAASTSSTTVRGAAAAALAQESLFAEAMLSAMRARIAEFKQVTH